MGVCLTKLKDAKPIEGWEDYFVTPEGEIYKVSKVAVSENSAGYLYAKVMIAGKVLRESVHRLVAKAFLENPLGLTTVDHIDGNRKNNGLENLQWFSLQDNIRKAFRGDYHLKSPDGVVHHFSNIREFSGLHNLDCSSVCKVLSGKSTQTKGWTALRLGEEIE